MPDLVAGAQNVAGFSYQTGVNVQYMKIIVLEELLILAGQIAQMLTMAGATFGASLAAVAGLKALGQYLARAAVTGLNASIASLAISEGLQLGVDAVGQTVQLALRTRRRWDDALTVDAAIVGAVGAVLGPVAHHGFGAPLNMIKGRVGEGLSRIVSNASHEYLTAGSSGAITGRGWSGTPWDVTAGGAEGTAEALTRRRQHHGAVSPDATLDVPRLRASVDNVSAAPGDRSITVPADGPSRYDVPSTGEDRGGRRAGESEVAESVRPSADQPGGPESDPRPVRRLRADAVQAQPGQAHTVIAAAPQTQRVEAFEINPDGQVHRVDSPHEDPVAASLASRHGDQPNDPEPGTTAAPVPPARRLPERLQQGADPAGLVAAPHPVPLDVPRDGERSSTGLLRADPDRAEVIEGSGPAPRRTARRLGEMRDRLDQLAIAARKAKGTVTRALHVSGTRHPAAQDTPRRRHTLRPSYVKLPKRTGEVELVAVTDATGTAPPVPQLPAGAVGQLRQGPAEAASSARQGDAVSAQTSPAGEGHLNGAGIGGATAHLPHPDPDANPHPQSIIHAESAGSCSDAPRPPRDPAADDADAAAVASGGQPATTAAPTDSDGAAAHPAETPPDGSATGQAQSTRPGTHTNLHDPAHHNDPSHREEDQSTTGHATVVAEPGHPRRSWIRRHWWVPVAALVVPLLVVTGALVVRKGNDQQPQNPSADPLAPFYQAVGNLAASPVIRYQMSAASEQADVRVISDGTAVGEYGTGISDIQRYQVLTAAGKSYFKDSQGLVHPLLKDQWFIPSPDDGGFSSAADAWPSPAQAAQTLRTVVDRAEPEATETSVDGTPALKAAIKIYGSTRDELYITRQEPYRVLRYIPSEDTARLGRRLGESDRPKPLSGERNGQIDTSALGSFLSLPRAPSKPDPDDYKTRYDFIPQTFDDYNQTFADAVTAIKQTANAADLTIKLRALNDEGQCGTAGCTVSVTVSNTVNPEPAGQIWARMQAQFTINGTPVGSCVTPPQQMPANESSTLSCSDPKAVLPGVKGEYRWYIPWVVYAIANTQDDVDRQVDQLDRQQQQADAFLCVIDSESCTGTQPIDDLAQYRQRQGLPPVAGGGQATMVARLDVGGRTYYGKGGQERTGDRAEADVFQQADTDKVTSPTAVLYVDTKLCETCGDLARIGDLLRNTKIQQVIVVTPSGRRVLIQCRSDRAVGAGQ